ncbi:MAG: sigma-54-dependent Fis family transcriptional regulator [Thiotrichaceae bacterium]|nr:sigma-54-dependent Fis family transcriptional regulator [Thiotrichaceae bacterium]
MGKQSVLIVDDKKDVLRGLKLMLRTHNFSSVNTISSAEKVMPFVHKYKPDIILLDLHMPKVNGIEILADIKKSYQSIAVIIITADEQIDVAVDCVRMGAHDYFVKPVDQSRLILSINSIPYQKDANNSPTMIVSQAQKDRPFKKIITRNQLMQSLFSYIQAISNSTRPVLITGDTGTGKELFAQAIHKVRIKQPAEMVTVNIAGLDNTTFSDTLFGHYKGAFTGAATTRDGLVKRAQNSSLFLDEIGDLDKNSQVKLLRLLQDGSYYPLGSDKLHYNKAQIIAATNHNLDELITEGSFRRDLYHRLQVHIVKIPNLAERPDDIPLLSEYLVEKISEELGKPPPTIPKEVMQYLTDYSFPGNVRELETVLYNAVIQANDILPLAPIEQVLSGFSANTQNDQEYIQMLAQLKSLPSIHNITSGLINEAMKRTDDNVINASELLGITRQALYKRLQRNK